MNATGIQVANLAAQKDVVPTTVAIAGWVWSMWPSWYATAPSTRLTVMMVDLGIWFGAGDSHAGDRGSCMDGHGGVTLNRRKGEGATEGVLDDPLGVAAEVARLQALDQERRQRGGNMPDVQSVLGPELADDELHQSPQNG